MAQLKRIVVHCTGEPANAVRNREYYRRLFFDVNKWHHWGYHAIVYQNGAWERLQTWPTARVGGATIDNLTMANGAKGFNSDSLHIAYVGGINPISFRQMDTRTPEQRATLRVLISKWKIMYGIKEVVGHSQLPGVKKMCPCFDARKEYENV